MEVGEVLRTAWKAVEGADLPEALHQVAFREAVRLLSPAAAPSQRPASGVTGGTAQGPSGASTAGNDEGSGLGVSEAEIYDRVADGTGVDRNKLEELVHLDGDVLKVSIPGIKLGKNNAEKTRIVAQILTIVRGFGLEEAETPIDVVRAEVTRLKCYDSANFSTQLSKMNGFVLTGTGSNRRIRAKAPGIKAFPELVDSLFGAE